MISIYSNLDIASKLVVDENVVANVTPWKCLIDTCYLMSQFAYYADVVFVVEYLSWAGPLQQISGALLYTHIVRTVLISPVVMHLNLHISECLYFWSRISLFF